MSTIYATQIGPVNGNGAVNGIKGRDPRLITRAADLAPVIADRRTIIACPLEGQALPEPRPGRGAKTRPTLVATARLSCGRTRWRDGEFPRRTEVATDELGGRIFRKAARGAMAHCRAAGPPSA
jgi:hypothetical protein